MGNRGHLIIRLGLLLAFGALVAAFAGSQYGTAYRFVTVLCLSCMGVG